jgi:DNA adenine methylase
MVISSPIRWAGSKKKLLNEMLEIFSKDKENYIEPFLGSGVVLINILINSEKFKYKNYYVNDINGNIISFFEAIQKNCANVILELDKLVNSYNSMINLKEKEEFYYQIREKYNKLNSKDEKAVLFWFLMKAGYNGVYRVNRSGLFNVPYGKKEIINIDKENLEKISFLIKKVNFYNMEYISFLKLMIKNKINNKAFIYFDPPYLPDDAILNQNQVLYTKKIFDHFEFVENVININKSDIVISMTESKLAEKIYGERFHKIKILDIIRTINPRKNFKSREIVYTNIKKYTN